jgi:cytochrome c-type biogenesis protein CcmH/NrfF
MLALPFLSPVLHGQLGALDEVLLFCLPVVVAIVVLAVAARSARRREERARNRDRATEEQRINE